VRQEVEKMVIQRIACLSCGSSSFTRNEQNHLVCDHCGSVFSLKGNVCGHCGTVNPANTIFCNQCGERMKRRCMVCQHENPGNAEYCTNCDATLDALEFIVRRYLEDGAQAREELLRSKEADAVYVAEQSERLKEIDRERLAALTVQKQEQTRQERMMMLAFVGGGMLLLLVFAVAIWLRVALGGG
jgi:hypothetical protein